MKNKSTEQLYKKIPTGNPRKEFREEDQDYLQAASATDCTGLIPASPQNEDELDNYEDIQHFLPPEPLESSAKNQSKKSK